MSAAAPTPMARAPAPAPRVRAKVKTKTPITRQRFESLEWRVEALEALARAEGRHVDTEAE